MSMPTALGQWESISTAQWLRFAKTYSITFCISIKKLWEYHSASALSFIWHFSSFLRLRWWDLTLFCHFLVFFCFVLIPIANTVRFYLRLPFAGVCVDVVVKFQIDGRIHLSADNKRRSRNFLLYASSSLHPFPPFHSSTVKQTGGSWTATGLQAPQQVDHRFKTSYNFSPQNLIYKKKSEKKKITHVYLYTSWLYDQSIKRTMEAWKRVSEWG